MANFKTRLSAKLIIIIYYIGRLSGAYLFDYQSSCQSVTHSRTLTICFTCIRIIYIPVFLYLSYVEEPKDFTFEHSTYFLTMISITLISISIAFKQLRSAKNYSNLLNQSFKVLKEFRNLVKNDEFFTQNIIIFFLILKTFLNLFIFIVFFPRAIIKYRLNLISLIKNFILVYMPFGIDYYFSLNFLLMFSAASVLENLQKHLDSIYSLKDLNEFLILLRKFHKLFLEFARLTEFDIFLIFCYYFSSITYSLMWFADDFENWVDIFYTCNATLSLLIFNITADNIIRFSKFKDFGSSKYLTNDSLVVSIWSLKSL